MIAIVFASVISIFAPDYGVERNEAPAPRPAPVIQTYDVTCEDDVAVPSSPRTPLLPPEPAPPAPAVYASHHGETYVALVDDDDRYHEGDDHTEFTFEVEPSNRFEVHNFNGDVQVSAWKRNAIRIRADHSSGVRVAMERTGALRRIEATWDVERRDRSGRRRTDDEIHVNTDVDKDLVELEELREMAEEIRRQTRQWRGGVPSVDYEITVPKWIPVGVYGVNTDVSVEGTEGELRVETINGDVWVDGGNMVYLSSTNGEVFVRRAAGRVRISSINDDVSVEEVVGNVFGEAVNGDIVLRTIRADTIRTSTVRGDVFYEGAIQRRGKYFFSSHTGDVFVVVPKSTSADVSFYTFNGEMHTGFPVRLFENRSSTKQNKVLFQLGRGGAELELKTFSGDIQLDWLSEDSR